MTDIQASSRTFHLPGISCQHCVAAITDSVAPLPGVVALRVDLETKTVTVEGGDEAAIVAAIDDAGYDVADVGSAG
jgi:copper ion binding protein